MYIGGSKGALGMLPFVRSLSFSCSFRQISCQIISFCPKFRGWHPLGNPGSATDVDLCDNLVYCYSTRFTPLILARKVRGLRSPVF